MNLLVERTQMNEKTTPKLIYPILSSLFGMAIGFTIFLITEKIIFLIAFVTIGLTMGLVLSQQKQE